MIGAPIYLVSACGSGAEFVAAFRRYADKQGIFVPIAEPFAIGRRGRMALTLKDGGVMIEGEAEVVMSSRTPSALYGRIGMTLRFVEPDEESRNVIGELERARLSMKPPETNAQPRPTTIPAEPRAVAPTPGGRIDAANALAETVAIGDVSALRESAGTPLKSGPKFVIPSIPARGGRDTKPPLEDSRPTAKLDNKPAPKLDAVPVKVDAPPPQPEPAKVDSPAPPPAQVDAPPPAIATPQPERAKVDSLSPTTVSRPPSPPAHLDSPEAATVPSNPSAKLASPAHVESPPEQKPEPARVESPAAAAKQPEAARVESPEPGKPVEPAPPTRTITQPVAVVPPPRPGTGDVTPMAAVRSPITSTQPVAVVPPAPRGRGTIPPGAPLKVPDATGPSAIIPDPPIVAAAPVIEESSPSGEDPTVPSPGRQVMSEVEVSEQTDLGYVPVPEPREPAFEPRESRRTVLGIAAVVVEPALPAARLAQEPDAEVVDPHADTLSPDAMMIFAPPRDDAPPPPTIRAIGLAHPPTVEESTPSGDWTMTPDGPKATPRAAPRPTGDWTISVDASAPDGWAPPEKPTVPARPTRRGPNVTSAASREDLILKQSWEPESTAMSMAKVEIDPTLMEPLLPMPEEDEVHTPGPATLPPPPMQPSPWPAVPNAPPMMQPMAMHTPLPMAMPPMPPQQYGAPMLTPVPGTYYTPVPGQVQFDPNQQVAMMGFPQQQPRLSTEGGAVYFPDNVPSQDSTAIHEVGRRRRLLVIVMSAALVLALGVVLLVELGGGKKHADEARPDAAAKVMLQPPPPSDAAVAVVAADAATVAMADAAALLPMPDATALAECFIDVVTNPPGAEVALDKSVLGVSPATFPLPCGTEVKVFYRKSGYLGVVRSVMPTTEGTKVRISLLHSPFLVKVSSSPAGATVTANGKALGVTPTIVKLPAFEASTIVFTKDGYTTDSEKITPKQDRQALHANLKKLPKRH